MFLTFFFIDGYVDGYSMYTYCIENPFSYIDPFGLRTWKITGKVSDTVTADGNGTFTYYIKDGNEKCVKITVTVKVVAKVTKNGKEVQSNQPVSVTFKAEILPNKDPKKCCLCKKGSQLVDGDLGWVQIVTRGSTWKYDNQDMGRAGPDKVPDVERPENSGSPGEQVGIINSWGGNNPWYGGPGNVTDERKKKLEGGAWDDFKSAWPGNPGPQSEIRDSPSLYSEKGTLVEQGFLTRLVCTSQTPSPGTEVWRYWWASSLEKGKPTFQGGEKMTIKQPAK